METIISETLDNNKPEWTVKQILKEYPELGIPHFQRGLVWNTDSVSLLLESLFYGTPCGTIILWEPSNPSDNGIHLPGEKDDFKRLIIDGQQRIRSLRGALENISTEDDDGDEDGHEDTIWCVNLARIPDLSGLLEGGLEGNPLFMKVKDPSDEKARYKYNIIPLKMFIKSAGRDLEWDRINPHENIREVLETIKRIELSKRLQGIYDRKLFVISMKESNTDNRLHEMVQLYNRINSSGKRVESEERAFATLVSIWPGTGKWLKELFSEIHKNEEDGNPAEKLSRDDMLKRKKERNFGFKLFIRTLIQTFSYHFGYSLGSGSFSFDWIDRPEFNGILTSKSEKSRVEALFEHTKDMLIFVKNVLKEELKCDDLQTLPETVSLLPVFHLLIRYPNFLNKDKQEKYRPLFGLLILEILLAEKTQRDILKIIRLINEANTARDCVEELRKEITFSAGDLKDRLAESNSLQDRYVLLFYWLLRKNSVSDFSYKNVDSENFRHKAEVEICDKEKPEKQHIVPYSKLKEIFGIQDRARLSSHPANNIGNITYISKALNSYDTGLGSKPINLYIEPPENLRRHFLIGKDEETKGSTLVELYSKIIMAEGEETESIAKLKESDFKKICGLRRELICRGFENWVKDLSGSLSIDDRIEPEWPFWSSTGQYNISKLHYPDEIEDSLISMIRGGAKADDSGKDEEKYVEFWFHGKRNRDKENFRMHLYCDKIKIKDPEKCPEEFKKFMQIVAACYADLGKVEGWDHVFVKPEQEEKIIEAIRAFSV